MASALAWVAWPPARAQAADMAGQAPLDDAPPAAGPAGATSPGGMPSTLPLAVAMPLQAAGVPAEAVSMLVWPVEPGAQPRVTHQVQATRQIASVMKLFTTGVALGSLGPAFTWRTDAALGGPLRPDGRLDGPLHIRGSGDPGLVLESVLLMVARWRAAGLRDIGGDVLIDRRAFDVPPHDPAAFDGQALKPYNAGPDALLLNHQAVTLRFAPDATRPGQVRVSMEPELAGLRLDARVRMQGAGGCGDWREAMSLSMQAEDATAGPSSMKRHGRHMDMPAKMMGATPANPPPSGLAPWTLSVQGPYPAACGTRDWPVLWQGDGPGDHAARLLLAAARQAGIQVHGHIRPGDWPDGTPVWQSWASAPLGQVVRDINKFSNNVMARQLFLTLGGQASAGSQPAATPTAPPSPATLDKARTAVTQQVLAATRDAHGQSPCDGEALSLDNGSGLSRTERGSAACLGRWLQAMWASPTMPEFIASLPLAGMDGTARRLASVSGRAHIKTGSLDGVAALAGYVEGESGRRYVVVGIINHPQADAARPALEALLAWTMRDNKAVAP